MKIIIAEDDKELGLLLTHELEKKGHSVMVNSRTNVVSDVQHNLPDLVFLDINLSHDDGGDICSELKDDHRTRDVRVILMSGIREIRQISQMCGADDYLMKPFELSELNEKLSRWDSANK